ncbi:hypothetical protein HanRHA438_Chr13g0578901 [Helianthus annuus]|nr:hypothetical protein HanRHA438_Chr13g0578901 [Helianthus annuus]
MDCFCRVVLSAYDLCSSYSSQLSSHGAMVEGTNGGVGTLKSGEHA